tara:strand:+ start:1677 stop:2045 length:369 start_codon:yes stop_codon:yes gene_type:complete
MRKIVVSFLAAISLPISVYANIEDQFFPNLNVRPRDFSEWYHLGVITSYGGLLCTQLMAEDLTLAKALGYRDGMVNVYSKEGDRAKEFTEDAINEGILVMQNMNNSPFSNEKKKKCNLLKIK